jgi:starch phosphorylase
VLDPARRDDLEASAFYELVEKQVRTRFYDRDDAGVPKRWVEMVRHTLETLGPKVLASRMVRDYVHHLYTPAAGASRALAQEGFAPARELAAWRATIVASWPRVRVLHVEGGGIGDQPAVGSTMSVRATVDLGGLSPDDVVVQAVYGRVDEHDVLHRPVHVTLAGTAASEDGFPRYEGDVPLDRAGSFGYTVRVLPHHELLPNDADLGLLAQP